MPAVDQDLSVSGGSFSNVLTVGGSTLSRRGRGTGSAANRAAQRNDRTRRPVGSRLAVADRSHRHFFRWSAGGRALHSSTLDRGRGWIEFAGASLGRPGRWREAPSEVCVPAALSRRALDRLHGSVLGRSLP